MSQGGASSGQGASSGSQALPQTFTPTSTQLSEIQKINGNVNNDPRWIGKDGFCVPAMLEKMQHLQTVGIPLGAMMPVTVDAGPRYNNVAHSILKITGAGKNGAPAYLDINQPTPLSDDDLKQLGYTIL
jgi:hypothetical protein